MEWRDEGIVLGVRRHGETSAIVEVMTRTRGRHLGLVRGGRSRRLQPVLQAGNRLDIVWRARLDEHLGLFQVEPLALHAARLMSSAAGVNGLQTIASHLRLLPERDPHAGLFDALCVIVEHLDQPEAAGELLVRFELMLLEELGFGLDLSQCGATGARDDLAYVSPKSGRAISRAAGEPWRDRMFALPAFLAGGSREAASMAELENAFRMTGFFLNRHAFEVRGMEAPAARESFIRALRRSAGEGRPVEGENAA